MVDLRYDMRLEFLYRRLERGVVLREHEAPGRVAVEAVDYEDLSGISGQHGICRFLSGVARRHAQKAAGLLYDDQPLVFIDDLQVVLVLMSPVFPHTCCFRVQS